jgi:hypothetical protein
MRAPFRNAKGSGRKELLGNDAYVGIGETVHAVPPPVPACTTETVCADTPAAETVTVAVRAVAFAFACAVSVNVTLPAAEPLRRSDARLPRVWPRAKG